MPKGNTPIMNQLEKLFRHTRANSYATRARYKNSCKTFVEFLDKEFRMKNLANLQDKHLVAYIKYRKEEGITSKTIKNDLGAIRYMHDMIHNAKYLISDNQTLQKENDVSLDSTPAVKGDRGWTEEEFISIYSFLNSKVESHQLAQDLHDIIVLCRTMGFRITEAVAMRRAQVRQASRNGQYQVQSEAKNGKWRKVPLSPVAHQVMLRRVADLDSTDRLFVGEDEKTHEVVLRFENALAALRDRMTTDEGREKRTWNKEEMSIINPLTFHGLRYSYVQERMKDEMDKGYSWEIAAGKVTQEVGHNRIDVIKVYLADSLD